jgi:hypothetical protein
MFTVHFYNFGSKVHGFTIKEEAFEFGRSRGFDFTVEKDGDIVMTYSVISGLHMKLKGI